MTHSPFLQHLALQLPAAALQLDDPCHQRLKENVREESVHGECERVRACVSEREYVVSMREYVVSMRECVC